MAYKKDHRTAAQFAASAIRDCQEGRPRDPEVLLRSIEFFLSTEGSRHVSLLSQTLLSNKFRLRVARRRLLAKMAERTTQRSAEAVSNS
jgi:hypothetical protein